MLGRIKNQLSFSGVAGLGGCLLLASAAPLSAAVLTHRYPFDTNANDVVGGANGSLQGSAVITNGAVNLRTTGRVTLPANLFTNYDAISFEAWFVEESVTNSLSSSYPEALYNFSGTGGSMIFFDGHAKKISGSGQFDDSKWQPAVQVATMGESPS